VSKIAAWILYYVLYRPSSIVAIVLAAYAVIAKSHPALAIAVVVSAFAPWIDSRGYPEGVCEDSEDT
jgi:hypothetical protein